MPQDEARLRALFTGLQQYGRVLVIVDRPKKIGALPIDVARDCGWMVASSPGQAMGKRRPVPRTLLPTRSSDCIWTASPSGSHTHGPTARHGMDLTEAGTKKSLAVSAVPPPRRAGHAFLGRDPLSQVFDAATLAGILVPVPNRLMAS